MIKNDEFFKPLYEHDCNKCKFIGRVLIAEGETWADLYLACQPKEEVNINSTFIIRYGSESDYITTDNLNLYLMPYKLSK